MAELDSKVLHEQFEYRDGKLLHKIAKARNKIKPGDEAGSISLTGYRYVSINKKLHKTHRIIYFMIHGEMPDYIDHIDGNKLNNKIENLRKCTKAQNAFNRKPPASNKSGHKNVSYYKRGNTWRSYVSVGGKQINGGFFENIEDAVIASTLLRQQYHGEFANHG